MEATLFIFLMFYFMLPINNIYIFEHSSVWYFSMMLRAFFRFSVFMTSIGMRIQVLSESAPFLTFHFFRISFESRSENQVRRKWVMRTMYIKSPPPSPPIQSQNGLWKWMADKSDLKYWHSKPVLKHRAILSVSRVVFFFCISFQKWSLFRDSQHKPHFYSL